MGLSSNILWHQTNYNSLWSILKTQEILCSYSMEIMASYFPVPLAFPMVSMCDLPFSEFASYIGKYGDYSIGLSREWGLANRFNSVWYCEKDSMVADVFKNYIKEALKIDQIEQIIPLFKLLAFVKVYEDELPNHDYEKYRFCDEKEMRYVPSFDYMLSGSEAPVLSIEDYNIYKNNHKGSSTLSYGVKFEWSDVKYIVVKEDYQIERFRSFLLSFSSNTNRICVFSNKQIQEDFIGIKHDKKIEHSEEYLDYQAVLRHFDRMRNKCQEMYNNEKRRKAEP